MVCISIGTVVALTEECVVCAHRRAGRSQPLIGRLTTHFPFGYT